MSDKKFTQRQAQAMYQCLKRFERRFEEIYYDKAIECEEYDWLEEIRETLKGVRAKL